MLTRSTLSLQPAARAQARQAAPLNARRHGYQSRRLSMWRDPASTRKAPTVCAAFNPPTLSNTKASFLKLYSNPIPAIYNTVVQELLVQQHFDRFSVKYAYDEGKEKAHGSIVESIHPGVKATRKVYALGLVNTYDQILENVPEEEREKVLKASIKAIDEDPAKFTKDAADIAAWAQGISLEELVPKADGEGFQAKLATISARAEAGKFHYTKFFAIGLFRLLELTGAKDPKALESLVKAMNVRKDLVDKDLMMYKGILSKLVAAKELMDEVQAREKRKQAERDAAKAEAAAKAVAPAAPAAAVAEKQPAKQEENVEA